MGCQPFQGAGIPPGMATGPPGPAPGPPFAPRPVSSPPGEGGMPLRGHTAYVPKAPAIQQGRHGSTACVQHGESSGAGGHFWARDSSGWEALRVAVVLRRTKLGM
ncbi:hypothetical protein D7Y04_37360 [Corallococcus sp. AB038B]|nr:hypothetical protein D7Y04_37360 [Corallococcus sp. AB038B]